MEKLKHTWKSCLDELRMLHWHAKFGLVLILVGVLLVYLKIWPGQQALQQQTSRLLHLQQRKPANLALTQIFPSVEESFHSLLPAQQEMTEHIAQILKVADTYHLHIEKAEYNKAERVGHLHRHLVHLPINGQYTQIRQFINNVLNTQPYVALSEINLKRDDVGSEMITAQILFTIYTQ